MRCISQSNADPHTHTHNTTLPNGRKHFGFDSVKVCHTTEWLSALIVCAALRNIPNARCKRKLGSKPFSQFYAGAMPTTTARALARTHNKPRAATRAVRFVSKSGARIKDASRRIQMLVTSRTRAERASPRSMFNGGHEHHRWRRFFAGKPSAITAGNDGQPEWRWSSIHRSP